MQHVPLIRIFVVVKARKTVKETRQAMDKYCGHFKDLLAGRLAVIVTDADTVKWGKDKFIAETSVYRVVICR